MVISSSSCRSSVMFWVLSESILWPISHRCLKACRSSSLRWLSSTSAQVQLIDSSVRKYQQKPLIYHWSVLGKPRGSCDRLQKLEAIPCVSKCSSAPLIWESSWLISAFISSIFLWSSFCLAASLWPSVCFSWRKRANTFTHQKKKTRKIFVFNSCSNRYKSIVLTIYLSLTSLSWRSLYLNDQAKEIWMKNKPQDISSKCN